MSGLENVQELDLETPFGKPSAPIVLGALDGKKIAFLARHGTGHHITPSEVNFRANIYALKSVGAQRIVSISATGSLREDYVPGEIVVPDQLFDFTHRRQRSFFGDSIVSHISVADPFCPHLSQLLFQATQEAGAIVHQGGTMITIEGPRFSTRAESNVYRSWGMSLIGMTTSPEAFLAREAEICYAVMAHVTDYDVWHISEEAVTVEMIIEILNRNTQLAQKAIVNLVSILEPERPCDCGQTLANTLITNQDVMLLDTRQKLHLFLSKYLK
jgi:5'-methylthioadenosine phosphorylase